MRISEQRKRDIERNFTSLSNSRVKSVKEKQIKVEEEIKKEKPMLTDAELLNIYDSGSIDYNGIREKIIIDKNSNDSVDVSVIVPVTGRENFTLPLISHFKSAMEEFSDKKYSITFVEHSEFPLHRDLCKNNSNYIFIPRGRDQFFNKCLAMNVGFIFSNDSKYYIFHDLDLLMKGDFFRNLFINIEKNGTDKSLQCFGGRKVVVMDKDITNLVINGTMSINSIKPDLFGGGYCRPGAPGGSILVSRENFLGVGGFDPEFFHSYSCEDAFFYEKLVNTKGIVGCNDPLIDLFHMDHPRLNGSNNPDIKNQMNILNSFLSLDPEGRMNFIKEISNRFTKKYYESRI